MRVDVSAKSNLSIVGSLHQFAGAWGLEFPICNLYFLGNLADCVLGDTKCVVFNNARDKKKTSERVNHELHATSGKH